MVFSVVHACTFAFSTSGTDKRNVWSMSMSLTDSSDIPMGCSPVTYQDTTITMKDHLHPKARDKFDYILLPFVLFYACKHATQADLEETERTAAWVAWKEWGWECWWGGFTPPGFARIDCGYTVHIGHTLVIWREKHSMWEWHSFIQLQLK